MILDFLSAVFTGIGFTIALFAIGYGGCCLFDKTTSALKLRRERNTKLFEILERIEANTRAPRA